MNATWIGASDSAQRPSFANRIYPRQRNGFKKPKFVCRMVDDVSMLDSNLADASGFANSEMTWQDCSLRNTQAPE
jgi:hypothetical protein